jgi:cytosine/adenosine deaminase-related metal-dependent hydrolase
MTVLSAEWVLPIVQPPIRQGYVSIAGGQVVAVGQGVSDGVNLGRVALLPALVNAHTHLELSYLRQQVPPGASFVDWVRALLARRMTGPGPTEESVLAAAAHALDEAVASGTGVFGDVSNSLATVPLLERGADAAVVFHELLGFRSVQAEPLIAAGRDQRAQAGAAHVRVSVAPHAPYSVSPALFQAIGRELDATPGSVTTLHLAESPEEVELLKQGTGPWRPLLDELGAWEPEWTPPGTSPVQYAAALGYLDRPTLVVHGVQCTPADIGALASSAATLVTCPRSNRYLGVGDPPLQACYDAGVRVAIGTDSLASAPTLSMFDEMAAVRSVAPAVPARRILESATRIGAEALGCGDRHGHIAIGAASGLIAVRVPDGVRDVEEYLVSGIPPDRVSWAWRPRGAEPQTS